MEMWVEFIFAQGKSYSHHYFKILLPTRVTSFFVTSVVKLTATEVVGLYGTSLYLALVDVGPNLTLPSHVAQLRRT